MMRDTRHDITERQVIWMSILTCIPAAPVLACAALVTGAPPQAALSLYLAVCLIPTVGVLAIITAALAREQFRWQSGGPDLRQRVGCGDPDCWSRAQ